MDEILAALNGHNANAEPLFDQLHAIEECAKLFPAHDRVQLWLTRAKHLVASRANHCPVTKEIK